MTSLSDRLLPWFEKRRKSRTLTLAQQEMMKAIDTVNILERALAAFCEGNAEESKQHIERLFQEEVEIDNLRRAVFEELTKGELPPKYREDLKSLVGRLDRLADNVKDAARNIKILAEAKAVVPKEILVRNLQIARNLVECTRYLNMSIEALGSDPVKAKELTFKVDAYEGLIDDEVLDLKILFVKTAREVNAPTLMILKDLVDAMEQASDMCDDTADYVRTLAIAEKTE